MATNAPPDQPPVDSDFAITTYRYLRIGMVVIVLALAISIGLERAKVDCFQTSISAYFYTPVRAIFVGGLLGIGVSLIVIKGSFWEDIFLNVAGMLAPIVAVAPTSGTGGCWSVPPSPLPKNPDGTMADWVVASIDNNIRALVFTGFVGLLIAAGVAAIAKKDLFAAAKVGSRDLRFGLLLTLAYLLGVLALHAWWDRFTELAHGYAAVAMFVFLAFAIMANAWERRAKPDKRRYLLIYAAIATTMLVGGAVLRFGFAGWDHMVLWLEGIEITLFATFWLVQTREHWKPRGASAAPGTGVVP